MKKIAIGIIMIIIMIGYVIHMKSLLPIGREIPLGELNNSSKIILVSGMMSVFVMWGWMLRYVIKNCNIKFRTFWGIFIAPFNIFGAVLFFVIIYVPRTLREP